MYPVKIEIKEQKFLKISWDDDYQSEIGLMELRKACPCAICDSENKDLDPSHFMVLNSNQFELIDVKIVGQYALGITWKDGHNTGIYEFNYLRSFINKED